MPRTAQMLRMQLTVRVNCRTIIGARELVWKHRNEQLDRSASDSVRRTVLRERPFTRDEAESSFIRPLLAPTPAFAAGWRLRASRDCAGEFDCRCASSARVSEGVAIAAA